MKKCIFSKTLILILWVGLTNTDAQFLVDVETGSVSTGYNNVRIPGNTGTLFSLTNDLNSKTNFFYRIRLNYTIKSRHTISVLYAPLEVKSDGRIKNNIVFEGVTFPANTELTGIYKFNSYRLTYRYEIVRKPTVEFGLGLTAKIRDAKIALASASLASEKANVGFIPIVNFRILWNFSNKFGILFEGDALAAPQGRAEDVLLALNYKVSENLNVRAGYRILEGGANNDEVYNFSAFHYTSVGLAYTFNKK